MRERTILVATTNPGKATEFRELLGPDLHWLSLTDRPGLPDVVEDGATFAENARKKAIQYARAAGLWTLSDDSGLVVDALDGAPGVRSARFAGVTGPRAEVDRVNMEHLLEALRGLGPEARTARFVCHLCLADPAEGLLAETTGTLEGRIHSHPVGDNGFGYDPVFFIPDRHCTAAELTADEKNAISHRGKALRSMKPRLLHLLAGVQAP